MKAKNKYRPLLFKREFLAGLLAAKAMCKNVSWTRQEKIFNLFYSHVYSYGYFLSYALKHPEASIRMPVAVLHIFYFIYVIVMLTCLVKFFKSKK